MQIDDKLVNHLAKLSRLSFTNQESDLIKQDMCKITGFIEKLNELDTTGVAPLQHMQGLLNSPALNQVNLALRADVAAEPMDNTLALREASVSKAPYFLVPKVLDK